MLVYVQTPGKDQARTYFHGSSCTVDRHVTIILMTILTPTWSQNSYLCGHEFTVLVEGFMVVLICSQILTASVEEEKMISNRTI